MVNISPLYYSLTVWRQNFYWKKFAQAYLSVLGTWTILIQIFIFIGQKPAEDWFRANWWVFGTLGFFYALYSVRPKIAFSYKLKNRDVKIEIRIANAFRMKGDIVIPTNTAFDNNNSGRILSAKSMQGEFIRQYYDGDIKYLDVDIQEAIKKAGHKANKKSSSRYDVGTVIEIIKQERRFYFVTVSHIMNSGRAYGTDEELLEALPKLWYYLSEFGHRAELVIPIIGTGYGGVKMTREEVVRELIKSFIASCSSKNYMDKITICILPSDVKEFKIDLNELEAYLKHSCTYAEFDTNRENKLGKGIR